MATDVTFPAAAAAGLLSFLSPCVLPLVPPYLTFLAGVTVEDLSSEGRSARAATCSSRPSSSSWALAPSSPRLARPPASSGRRCAKICRYSPMPRARSSSRWGCTSSASSKSGFMSREKRAQVEKPFGLFGAYVMGLAFAFGWTPCIGPILAAILAIAGAQDTVGRGAPAARGLFAGSRRSLPARRSGARAVLRVRRALQAPFLAGRAGRRRAAGPDRSGLSDGRHAEHLVLAAADLSGTGEPGVSGAPGFTPSRAANKKRRAYIRPGVFRTPPLPRLRGL